MNAAKNTETFEEDPEKDLWSKFLSIKCWCQTREFN